MIAPDQATTDRFESFEQYIQGDAPKAAYRHLIEEARLASGYELVPEGKAGAKKKSARYLIARRHDFSFIVLQDHLLFYYRKPSGRATETQAALLKEQGLSAYLNNKGEVVVHITTPEQAVAVLADAFGATSTVSGLERDWTDDELAASVAAYRDIQNRERLGERGFKAQIYRDLATRFGRTAKAFEFRMQNISAVLAMMGREWVPGLKPANNVGTQVATRIERCINDLDGTAKAPEVAFELEVKGFGRQVQKTRPAGQAAPSSSLASVKTFNRDAKVKAWVLARAKGSCECCRQPAPFMAFDGTPYLEVHHLRTLADGGSDRTSNTVAVCPNCHRRLHYGGDKLELRQQIIAAIPELENE